jgi:hypothetical protein
MIFETLALELNKTAAVFRSELSALAIDGYWEAFERDSDDDFVKACRRARAECDFMPTIKQLRSFMPDRRGLAAIGATERYLRRNRQLAERQAPWPRRLAEPTSVAELAAPYLEPPDKIH